MMPWCLNKIEMESDLYNDKNNNDSNRNNMRQTMFNKNNDNNIESEDWDDDIGRLMMIHWWICWILNDYLCRAVLPLFCSERSHTSLGKWVAKPSNLGFVSRNVAQNSKKTAIRRNACVFHCHDISHQTSSNQMGNSTHTFSQLSTVEGCPLCRMLVALQGCVARKSADNAKGSRQWLICIPCCCATNTERSEYDQGC